MKGRVLLIGMVAAIASILFLTPPAQAQTYPSQPIQLIVPMAPGDTVDLAGRAIATELAKILKTPVKPEMNREFHAPGKSCKETDALEKTSESLTFLGASPPLPLRPSTMPPSGR